MVAASVSISSRSAPVDRSASVIIAVTIRRSMPFCAAGSGSIARSRRRKATFSWMKSHTAQTLDQGADRDRFQAACVQRLQQPVNQPGRHRIGIEQAVGQAEDVAYHQVAQVTLIHLGRQAERADQRLHARSRPRFVSSAARNPGTASR